MLVQSFRRAVPGQTEFLERTLFRGRDFAIAVLRADAMALDRGVLGGAVQFPRRFRRQQLSIVLAGRGYIDLGGRVVSLQAGELLSSDQRLHFGEGYGGSPCEAIIVDWEASSALGGTTMAAAGSSAPCAIGTRDWAALRRHVAELYHTPADRWVEDLAARLCAIGLVRAASTEIAQAAPSPKPLARLYDAMGHVLSRLGEHPSLVDLARATGTSERQTKRHLAELTHSYGHSFESWRDFVHEMRLDWAMQLLSVRGLGLDRVSELAGYRSTVALHHALSLRGADTPRTIARRLAERWH
jgi:AraC-like DNA-binding protein